MILLLVAKFTLIILRRRAFVRLIALVGDQLSGAMVDSASPDRGIGSRQDDSPAIILLVVTTKKGVHMTDKQREEVLKSLTHIFADRLRLPPLRDGSDNDDALASVLPSSVEEVRSLSEIAASLSVPLVPYGARTGLEPRSTEGSILVRFDLMRNVRSPPPEEPWIEAEPGASWLQLEDDLRPRGRGLVVYPTSAPRATVGGWLAQDGLGVGSFEYGWLRENVPSASVILSGGELREVPGRELDTFFEPEISKGIVVGARIRTRNAAADVPFAAAFRDTGDLSVAVAPGISQPGDGPRQKPRRRLPAIRGLSWRSQGEGRGRPARCARARSWRCPRRRGCLQGVGREVLPGCPLAPDSHAHQQGADHRRGSIGGFG